MDDRHLTLLQEIRDLLQSTVANQEKVLRANDESMRLYRAAGRRQLIGIVATLGALIVFYLLFIAVSGR